MARHNLQWTPHVHDTIIGGDLINSFEFLENLAVAHEMVEAEIAERNRWCGFCHPKGLIHVFWYRELRDFARSGEKKRKEVIGPRSFNSRAKFGEKSPVLLRSALCQRMCLIKNNEDMWKIVHGSM